MDKLSGNNAKKQKKLRDPYPIDAMMNPIARGLLYATVAALPLMMDSTKYSAITHFKSTVFMCLLLCVAVLTIGAALLNGATRVTPRSPITRQRLLGPTFAADAALLTYWVFMLVSSIGAADTQTAFFGMNPRNNGFLYQTMYVAGYFIVSRGLKPKKSDALVFAWGGAALGAACILHFFGVDLYNIRSVNGSDYAGPFWTTTKYRFLGPVGNVNLGSYILAIAAVITAGLYVAGIFPGSAEDRVGKKDSDNKKHFTDRHGISLLLCFAVTIYAEYNINTDAGVVALAVAAVLMPAVLCTDMARLRRMLRIYFISVGLLLFNHWLVDFVLREQSFGNTDAALLALTLLLGLACAATTLEHVKGGLSKMNRHAMAACSGMALAVFALITSLLVTSPKRLASGESHTPVNTLGGWLRSGLSNDMLIAVLLLAAITVCSWIVIELYVKLRPAPGGKAIQRVCIGFAVAAVIGGLAVSLYITAPAPTAVGAVSGASKVIEQTDLKEKSDNMLQELGQMLRGNFDDSFGHNRLFTWKRTLRLVKLHPVFGIGPDNFKQFFGGYFHDEAVKQFPSSNGNLDKAHNEFLDVLISNGIAGLLAYLSFFGALLWYTLSRARKGGIAPVFGVAVVAYMAHAFFGYQLPIQSPVMWMMLAATALFARAEYEEEYIVAGQGCTEAAQRRQISNSSKK